MKRLRTYPLFVLAAFAGAAPSGMAQPSDDLAKVRAILQQLAAQDLPIVVAYRTCPGLFKGEYKIDATLPLTLAYELPADGYEVAQRAGAVEITVVRAPVRAQALPQAFDDSLSTDAALNKSHGAAFAEVLGTHAAAFGAWFAAGRSAELAAHVEDAIVLRVSQRLQQSGDRVPLTILRRPAGGATAAPSGIDLCPGARVGFSFPAAYSDVERTSRGSYPLANSDAARVTREFLRDANGNVLAYREVHGVVLSAPVGSFRVIESPPGRLGQNGSAGERIVNGTVVSEGTMPWAVAFVTRLPNGTLDAYCGGTLIAARWALTAAHCKINPMSVVIVGRAKLSGNSGSERKASQVWRHIEYARAQPFDADIALVRLDADVTERFVPVHPTELAAPTTVTVVGWGATARDGSSIDELHKVDLQIADAGTCRYAYRDLAEKVTGNMFCASMPDKDACQGDSGGGSFYRATPSRTAIAGIVSFGKGCADREFPGVYTKLAKYTKWIEDVRAAAPTE